MNRWEELYRGHAFKPHPSLWELASAHVPFDELGLAKPPEPRVLNAIDEGDGVVLLRGASGRGKSSVLAHVAANLGAVSGQPDRTHLPIFVPVAVRVDPEIGLDRFGREVIFEFLAALGDSLPEDVRDRLQRAIAREVSREHTPSIFNAKLLPKIPGLGAEIGVQLAHEVVALVGEERIDDRGGLRALGDIARVRGFELNVLVEDTDQWSQRKDGAETAEAFFTRVVRPLVADVGISVVVAVQDRWSGEGYVEDVASRAVGDINMPEIGSLGEARSAIVPILLRRIGRVIEDATQDSIDELFTDSALETLASDVVDENSFRAPLTRLRNTLDHFADALPDRLDRDHLIEGS